MNGVDLSQELQTAVASADSRTLERLAFWVGNLVLEEGIAS